MFFVLFHNFIIHKSPILIKVVRFNLLGNKLFMKYSHNILDRFENMFYTEQLFFKNKIDVQAIVYFHIKLLVK